MPHSTPNGLHFAPARTPEDAHEAERLVYDAYHRIGIVAPNARRTHKASHIDTNDSVTILGRIGGLCCSTLSAYVDHPEHGLPLDPIYPEEMAKMRNAGQRLIEVGMFADRRVEFDRSLYALLDLIRYATYFGVHRGATHAVIGVHPHHTKFYAKGLGFDFLGEEKHYGLLNQAPVVLMGLDWEAARERVASKPAAPRGLKHLLEHAVDAAWYDTGLERREAA